MNPPNLSWSSFQKPLIHSIVIAFFEWHDEFGDDIEVGNHVGIVVSRVSDLYIDRIPVAITFIRVIEKRSGYSCA